MISSQWGRPQSPECQCNLDIIMQVCRLLNIPLATQKVEGPTQHLEFLGITLDTSCMEARLPEEKLTRIYHTVANLLDKWNATKREILSSWACYSMLPRWYALAGYLCAGCTASRQKCRRWTTTRDFRSDLCWWDTFVTSWNGVSFLQMAPIPQASIQTDASGMWGCGAFFEGKWLQWQWTEEWLPIPMMAKEMVPIVLSCAVWGYQLAPNKTM